MCIRDRGYTAANLLMTRIEEPSLNYRTVYTETNLILRCLLYTSSFHSASVVPFMIQLAFWVFM